MDGIDRREADRLLTWLLDLPWSEREAALEAACDDVAMRRTVLRLVRAAEEPGGSVDPASERSRRLWTDFAARVAERETPLVENAVLGPYRILGEIDRGGMAVVYRAERVDGEFTREVAVKVLKLGIGTEEVVRRFEQERQILADLDHPSIARMFDGGRTEDGRPYVVMELVDGVPIDRYCDERRLSVEERLELFCVVAGAAEYAHQKLVVHRDLKPSNILVTAERQVKLLDFGIARLADVEVGNGVAVPSRARRRMMTPEYASPEQIRGERVTTASDVYQLGLLLYRILTGQRPYALSDHNPDALTRTICEQPSTPPSAVITHEPTIEALCHARRTTPSGLRRRLRGDLDSIALKALRKSPEDRYPSAEQLARDIRRHRAGLPVTARDATSLYRSRKFFARHAIGAITTLLVVFAGIGVAGFHTVRIRNERDRAQAEAANAEQMNQFLTGLFRGADPREARDAEVSARELLDRGVERIGRDLTAQPEIRANMLHVLGRTYLELGVDSSAEELLTRALELRRDRLGPKHPAVAELLGDLGVMKQRQGEFERARDVLEEANRILTGSLEGNATRLTTVLSTLGLVYRDLGRPNQARAALERALAIERRTAGEDSEAAASILARLGILSSEAGHLDRAETLFERALRIREARLGADHPGIAWTLVNLAITRKNRGKLTGLEPMYRRSLAIFEKAYGPSHRSTGWALNNLGDFLTATGRRDEAIDVLERAVEVQTSAAGPEHPELAIPLASLGDVHFAAGRLLNARRYYRQSARVREAALEKRTFDPLLAHNLVRLGRIEAELGNGALAERILDRAVEYWRRAPEGVDSQLATTLGELGRWLVGRRQCTDAVSLLHRAVRIKASRRASMGPEIGELERLLAACS